MSLLADHWKRIAGPVHPDDGPALASADHSFNLDFPPPAFVGNPDAPIVILMANGGYKPGVTEGEFLGTEDVAEHLAYLRGERKQMPRRMSDYYRRGTVGRWLVEGLAVSVNAVPYRSPGLSGEPANIRVARSLPSLVVHRRWLMDEVLPEATMGRRFLFVHRNSWWQVPYGAAGPTVRFSDPARAEPNRAAPDQAKLAEAEAWLQARQA